MEEETDMPIIECLVGPIASGKSTYARNRADEGALVISHDDLTQMLHAEYRYEEGKRLLYRRMEFALADLVVEAGLDLVIDRTHLTCESRARWIDYARSKSVPIVAVVFPDEGPHVHACRRYHSDARGRTFEEWRAVARHHFAQARAEPIDISEGFDYVKRVEGA
jgi:predicted kinase